MTYNDKDRQYSANDPTGSVNDKEEYLQQRMREDFGTDGEASLSRSSTPAGYTPTSGTDDECVILKSVNGAESTVEEYQETEFLTPPRRSASLRSEPSEMSFEQALQVFDLDYYLSVDIGLLQERLQNRLSWEDVDRIVVANAFTTIVKHQHEAESWTLRLRWDHDGDQSLLDDHMGTHHDNWEKTADEFGTTQDDCRQRWATLKPKDWVPSSAATGRVKYYCCLDKTWTPTMDGKLMSLKADNSSWADIARHFDLKEADCKDRFKQIRPKDWKPKSKKHKAAVTKEH